MKYSPHNQPHERQAKNTPFQPDRQYEYRTIPSRAKAMNQISHPQGEFRSTQNATFELI